jgi:hypothetical protein
MPTHIAYVWNPTNLTMKLYVNGQLTGTTTNVAANFVMPAGAGWLGANPDGSEGMVGMIHRVTVYDSVVSDTALARHANAYGAIIEQAAAAYDMVISNDVSAGLIPLSRLTNSVTVGQGVGGAAFDFGLSSGDAAMEFILEGNPAANNSAFLAVGTNIDSNLRYEAWDNTGELGFSLNGVADYQFSPGVASPTAPSHITYAWSATSQTMKLYLNGYLAGTTTGVDTNFAMPRGEGYLGCNDTFEEVMEGRIHRVTVYDQIPSEADILRHAKAFTDILRPPVVVSFAPQTNQIAAGGSTTLSWNVQNAKTVSINGVDRTSVTNLTVSPPVSTTYTLKAANTFGGVSAQVTVFVHPPLQAYDAAITADASGGLKPLAQQSSAVILTGAGGLKFRFAGKPISDATIEFIVEGETSGGGSTFLATDAGSPSSLRFEQWEGTRQLGFTQAGAEDYEFSPVIPSPSWPTHVTYSWNATALTMKLYVNGRLAGTRTNVDVNFTIPRGQGYLGCNDTGGEAMKGVIHRVVVYEGVVPEETILRHANAFMNVARPELVVYDNVITEGAAGGLTPLSQLLAPFRLGGTGGVQFDFGTGSGDMTLEFILEGDPSAAVSSTLGVGANEASLLRYEVGNDTGQLGFSQNGIADYQFVPGVSSPTAPTHVALVWNSGASTLKAYVNGHLAGATTGVDVNFAMPAGLGWLGANPDGSDPMTGTLHRVTVYDTELAEVVVASHAKAFLSGGRPSVSLEISGPTPAVTMSQGIPGLHYRLEYRTSLAAADSWQLLQDIPALSGTSVRVVDPTPIQLRRFYRAVQTP